MRPRDFGILAFAETTLGHEIVNTAASLLVSRVPILHRRVFDLGTVEGNQLDDGCVQLVLISHWRGATFEVANRSAFFRHDQRAFELAGVRRIYPEISG